MFKSIFQPSVLVTLWLVSFCWSSAQTPVKPSARKQGNQPQPKVAMAAWYESEEILFGISRTQFAAMGLSKLTEQEYVWLMAWVNSQKSKAKEEALAKQPSYSCGRPIQEPATYDKVNLLIEVGDQTPADITSGIRQRLRAIPDVQIVYGSKDADLLVSIIGFQNELTSGRQTGYTISIVTADPCQSSVGTYVSSFSMYRSHFLQTSGKEVNGMVEGIVTTLDAKDLEPIRKQNAEIKQSLLKNKK